MKKRACNNGICQAKGQNCMRRCRNHIFETQTFSLTAALHRGSQRDAELVFCTYSQPVLEKKKRNFCFPEGKTIYCFKFAFYGNICDSQRIGQHVPCSSQSPSSDNPSHAAHLFLVLDAPLSVINLHLLLLLQVMASGWTPKLVEAGLTTGKNLN